MRYFQLNRETVKRSLLENNKYYLLNHARSDLTKQDFHVELFHECIGEIQRQTREQRLALHDAQHGFCWIWKKKCPWRQRFFETLKSEICTKWEKWRKSAGSSSRRDPNAKFERKSQNNTTAHFRIATKVKTNEFYEWFWRFSRRGIKLLWKIVSRFQSTCNRVQHFEVWKIFSSNWSRGFELFQIIKHLHFINPQHNIRWKIRTSYHFIFESSFPHQKRLWIREFRRIQFRHLLSLLTDHVLLRKVLRMVFVLDPFSIRPWAFAVARTAASFRRTPQQSPSQFPRSRKATLEPQNGAALA